MRITRELRKAINQAVRENTQGFAPLVELGLRTPEGTDEPTENTLAWDWDDSDLWDLAELRNVTELDELPGLPGRVALDLYVTSGRGHDRELETNVGVAIVDGRVIAASADAFQMGTIEELARTWTPGQPIPEQLQVGEVR